MGVPSRLYVVFPHRFSPDFAGLETLLVFLHEDLPLHRDIKFQSFLDTMSTDGDVELVGD